jgi:DNA-binding NtrC family response regulator
MPPLILVADNDQARLEVLKEFFEAQFFKVETAINSVAARAALTRQRYAVAVLDIRLDDDDDESDISGLLLAKTNPSRTPIIILTAFADIDSVREAHSANAHGLPVAVDFISKLEGLDNLLKAVRETLNRNLEAPIELLAN